MQGWRVAKEKRINDLTGAGAAIAGGRWNDVDVPAVYLGLSPGICSLETFVHTTSRVQPPLKIALIELPDDPGLYWEPGFKDLPMGWNAVPADRPSMDFGTRWLRSTSHLGLIVPSVVMPLERNLVLNPAHPAMGMVRIKEVYNFAYDERMFKDFPKTLQ
ncbi:RES family NAD+ phosphorylase [Pseudomonas sp. TCU-HL1]|uniref:RES family NAD+ phosphorylase n=1 Tax=Pseudomonas sp. TCU-HL1 TaxID=1856685 RepID=UPI00083E4070|nr:RES family NAD+ phosphorylase [Pseudomonas sp. TCU-HL1]AOE85974.1 hypothetical protein THL1_3426 [Pseudomonas sp. TCU-HL1]